MKITPAHYEKLADKVQALDIKELRDKYLAGDFPRADKVKDLNKRYRWDLLFAAFADTWFVTELYTYLCDDHIDTALRKAVKDLQ